jgi:hypothetical protein
MIHKKCGGRLLLDCTSMYLIQSPSIKITTKGILPGVIQIDSNKSKGCAKLLCSECQKEFSDKESFENEILETCSLCRKDYPPSETKIIEYVGTVCVHCINRANSAKLDLDNIKDKMLSLYGQVLSKGDNPTLLTILMKK